MGLREQRGREDNFLEASKPRVRTQSAQFGLFANLDVKRKTTADFANRPHPPNQLRDPQKEKWCRFSIKSRNSCSVGISFRHFPRAHEVSQNLL